MCAPKAVFTVPIRKSTYLKNPSTKRLMTTEESRNSLAFFVPRNRSIILPLK